MDTWINDETLDSASFLGMLLGLALLITCLLVADLRVLGVPGLALLLPSLVYGLR